MANVNTTIARIINQAVNSVLAGQQAHATYTQSVAAMRSALPADVLQDTALVADALLEYVADKYGVPTKEAKSSGKIMMDSKSANSGAARTFLSRFSRDVVGARSNQKAEPKTYRFSAAQKAAGQALLDACGGDVARVRALLKTLA